MRKATIPQNRHDTKIGLRLNRVVDNYAKNLAYSSRQSFRSLAAGRTMMLTCSTGTCMLAHGPTSAVLASSACQDEFSSVPLINPTKWPPATDNLHLRILDPLDFRHSAKASITAVASDKVRLRASSSSESFFWSR